MQKIYSFTINPRNYETLVGFAHDACLGCIYNPSSSDMEENDRAKAAQECNECIDNILDKYYKIGNPVVVTKDEEGRNIAKTIIEK
jgi:hypothetical protein